MSEKRNTERIGSIIAAQVFDHRSRREGVRNVEVHLTEAELARLVALGASMARAAALEGAATMVLAIESRGGDQLFADAIVHSLRREAEAERAHASTL